ncbi:hypothetical protein JTB14_006482 [Gonioctena quinquepunctata]|nr:hypothetical protein JTB14_006482 [Gonioctena quinquepunctata]
MSRKRDVNREIRLGIQEILKVNCNTSEKADLINELFTKVGPSVADIVSSFEQLAKDAPYEEDNIQREFAAKWGPKWKIMIQDTNSESDDALDIYAPNIETNNKFQVLSELEETQVEQEETVISTKMPIQLPVMDTQKETKIKPPPIIIRDLPASEKPESQIRQKL